MTAKKTTPAAATTPAKVVEDTIATTKETMETALKQAQEVSTKNVDGAMLVTKEQLDKAMESASKGFEDAVTFASANADAAAASYDIVAKGGEAVARKVMDLSKASVENQFAIARKLLTVTTLTDLLEVTSDHAKASYDTMVSESTAVSEMMVKIANDATAPLSQRVNATMEIIGKPVAA